jgi:hypothetical protein
MPLPRPASPRALWSDLRAFTRERSRIQWIAAVFAVVMPLVILFGFYLDSKSDIGPGEQIIYAQSWPANRSDDEIKAQQKIDQKAREEALAERRRQFQRLEKRLGI